MHWYSAINIPLPLQNSWNLSDTYTPHSFSRVKFNIEYTPHGNSELFVCLHSIKMNYVNESEMKNKFYSFALYETHESIFCLLVCFVYRSCCIKGFFLWVSIQNHITYITTKLHININWTKNHTSLMFMCIYKCNGWKEKTVEPLVLLQCNVCMILSM